MKIAGYSILAGAVVAFLWWGLFSKGAPATPVTLDSKPVELNIVATDWKRGATEPKAIVVEYGDFQCPACGAYFPMVDQAQKELGKDVQFIFRHFPLTMLHKNALMAAKAAEAAGKQGKFWEMHDKLFSTQKDWSELANPQDMFVSYAQALGLDTVKFTTDLKDSAIAQKISDSYDFGSKLGINGTPTFFINSKKIENPKSYADFKALIEKGMQEGVSTQATSTKTN